MHFFLKSITIIFYPDWHISSMGINDIKGIKYFQQEKNCLIVYSDAIPLISRIFFLIHVSWRLHSILTFIKYFNFWFLFNNVRWIFNKKWNRIHFHNGSLKTDHWLFVYLARLQRALSSSGSKVKASLIYL